MAWARGGARKRRRLGHEKGPRGLAVQPKSREETPKVGTPRRGRPDHGAQLDMGMFVLRCNLASPARRDLGKNVAFRQRQARPYGNARARRRGSG